MDIWSVNRGVPGEQPSDSKVVNSLHFFTFLSTSLPRLILFLHLNYSAWALSFCNALAVFMNAIRQSYKGVNLSSFIHHISNYVLVYRRCMRCCESLGILQCGVCILYKNAFQVTNNQTAGISEVKLRAGVPLCCKCKLRWYWNFHVTKTRLSQVKTDVSVFFASCQCYWEPSNWHIKAHRSSLCYNDSCI